MQRGKIPENKYRPEINDKSLLLASQLKEQTSDQRVVEDRLISYKDIYMRQRTEKAEEKEEQESRMLSFHPSILKSTMTQRIDKQSDISKWEELHRQA